MSRAKKTKERMTGGAFFTLEHGRLITKRRRLWRNEVQFTFIYPVRWAQDVFVYLAYTIKLVSRVEAHVSRWFSRRQSPVALPEEDIKRDADCVCSVLVQGEVSSTARVSSNAFL